MAKRTKKQELPEATTPTNTPTPDPTISQEEMIRAATNDPALSPDEFKLGDRKFKIVDLEYNDYVKFLVKLKPLMSLMQGLFMQKQAVGVPGIALPDPSALSTELVMEYCLEDIPELAVMICKATDPEITTEDVKRLAGNPFALAEIVLKQVVRNQMISHFSSFFVHLLPLMRRPQQQK